MIGIYQLFVHTCNISCHHHGRLKLFFPAKKKTKKTYRWLLCSSHKPATRRSTDEHQSQRHMNTSPIPNKFFGEIQRFTGDLDAWIKHQYEEVQKAGRQYQDFAKESDGMIDVYFTRYTSRLSLIYYFLCVWGFFFPGCSPLFAWMFAPFYCDSAKSQVKAPAKERKKVAPND
jgi:hypothetical protein